MSQTAVTVAPRFKFQHSILSDTLLAVGRDAAHVVDRLCANSRAAAPA